MGIYFLLGMVVFFSVSLTIIHRLEKRMVWPYSELQQVPSYASDNDYAPGRRNDALAAGFTMLGWAHDVKGPTYRINYALLVSPQRDVFAVIGEGAILKLRLRATWLHTPTMDGRSFYSTDHQTGVQIDPSRNWRNQLVPGAGFAELLNRHREWIRACGVVPRNLTVGRELAEFRALREQHFRSMEHAGLIRFTDSSAANFYFTWYGAARTALLGYFLGLARGLSQGRFPRSA